MFYRDHGLNPSTGQPYPPIHFSQRATSRFDPKTGPGTLCLADRLAVALMEVFDDSWGAVGAPQRALTKSQIEQWWVSPVWLPQTRLFDAHGANLSKIGTDLQFVAGRHATTRRWALRFARHPALLDGVLYPSRHTTNGFNVAMMQRPRFTPAVSDPVLSFQSPRSSSSRGHRKIAYGPAIRLDAHPELYPVLTELQVALLP